MSTSGLKHSKETAWANTRLKLATLEEILGGTTLRVKPETLNLLISSSRAFDETPLTLKRPDKADWQSAKELFTPPQPHAFEFKGFRF